MAPLTALIAEDEPLLQAELADMLHAVWPELAIVGRANNGIERSAVHRPSAVGALLDIEMPGFPDWRSQLATPTRTSSSPAYDHARAAFDQGAIDYLVKPVGMERLATTMQRLKTRISRPPPDHTKHSRSSIAAPPIRLRYLRWINASAGGRSASSASRRSATSRPTPSTRRW
jgi:DNA-binding LytR/AlgR family response regulator